MGDRNDIFLLYIFFNDDFSKISTKLNKKKYFRKYIKKNHNYLEIFSILYKKLLFLQNNIYFF
ncbi:MAG: hypothetical protein EAZ85_11295 [Bacteroidetes bacterium]|nr:MAG: hypothetical protein EAZ85_11295 [Bacteroidota bacterium]